MEFISQISNPPRTAEHSERPATEETQLAILAQKAGGIPANKVTDAYSFQAFSDDGTYLYVFSEDGNGNWYIARYNSTTLQTTYTKGTGGYSSVYVNETSGPSGIHTWGTYDATFDNVGASSLNYDSYGNLKTTSRDLNNTGYAMTANGAFSVSSDRSVEPVDVYFCQTINAVTLASDAILDTYTVTLVGGHGVVAGNLLCFKEGTRFLQSQVLNVATNVITLDRPMDYAFTTAANVNRATKDMNVNGSVTPQIFRITPYPAIINFKITQIVFSIEDNSVMDTSTFGGLTALTRGIVVRKKDGTYKNFFNAKENDDFEHHCADVKYIDKAPSGFYGLRAIKKFSGPENHGIVVELDSSSQDELQIIIQDNLTGLTGFECVAKGRVYN